MAVSELRLIKRCAEFCEKKDIKFIPPWTRGIYVLFKYRFRLDKYDVVYIGMAAGTKTASIRGRLRVHRRKKGKLWTHFSAFEVWDNVGEEEVKELEKPIVRNNSLWSALVCDSGSNFVPIK